MDDTFPGGSGRRCVFTVKADFSAEEATVTTDIVRDRQQADHTPESERGPLVALLVMVVLGVAGIFAVSG